MLKYSILFLLVPFLNAYSEPNLNENEQNQQACLQIVNHMLQTANEAANSPTSRPERAAKRKKLVEEWKSQLKDGIPPCEIYSEIYKASNAF